MLKHSFFIGSFFCLLSCFSFAEESMPERGICSHRGVNSTHPENTLPAFAEAVRLGAGQVEFDVRQTKDGHFVIIHDATVDRTTDGTGKVAELTFEEIRELDAGIKKNPKFSGTKIPTFDEAIDSLPRNIWINVHLSVKPETAAEIARKIKEKNRTHQAFLACSRKCAVAAKEIVPEILICNMERQGSDISRYIRETIDWNCNFIQLVKLGTPDEMKQLQEAGVKINFFPAKTPEQFRELVEAGVDFPLVDAYENYINIARTLGLLKNETE